MVRTTIALRHGGRRDGCHQFRHIHDDPRRRKGTWARRAAEQAGDASQARELTTRIG